MRSAATLGISALALMAAPSPGAPAGTEYPVNYETGIVNKDGLAHFFRAMAVQRVDVVGIGDSNELLWTMGWDEAWAKALNELSPHYASGLISAGENFGLGAGVGWYCNGVSIGSVPGAQFSGAPTPWGSCLNASNDLRPLNYIFVPTGQVLSADSNMGIQIVKESPLDVNGPLRFHYVYGTFHAPGPQSIRPMVRLGEFPYSTLLVGAEVNTSTGVDGITVGFLDIPAEPRNATLNFRIAPYGMQLHGPMLWAYSRCENLSISRGTSFHTLYGYGGQDARDMGLALQRTSDAGLTLFFSQVRALQNGPPHVLVRVSTGVNDRQETNPSLGRPPILPGQSPAAFVSNVRAIIQRVQAIWELNGWDPDGLFFLISVSPPMDHPLDDGLLQAYRYAADDLTMEFPRVAVTHFERLTSGQELFDMGWWLSGGFDTFHFTPEAHFQLARRELHSAMMSAAWVDVNGDGRLDVDDVYSDSVPSVSQTVDVTSKGQPARAGLVRAVRWDEAQDASIGR